MKSFLLLTTLSLFIVVSCSQAVQPKQHEQLKALTVRLDSIEKKLEANAFDSSNYWRQESASIEIAIKRYYIPTKIDQNFAHKMDRFKRLQSIVDTETELGGESEEAEAEEEKKLNIGVRILLLRKGIQKEHKHLAQLNQDMENGAITSANVKTALASETKNMRHLEEGLREYLHVKNNELPVFIALCKELRTLAVSLQKKA
ncbi:MAG: hypothetical protein RLZZ301_1780 [Bacteroidota bacterium]|jgi:hypothetical protein